MSENPTLPSAPHAVAPPPRSRLAGPAAGIGLLAFMAAALASFVWGVSVGGIDLVPARVTAAAALDGTVSREIAARLAQAPLPDAAARLQRGLGWLALRDTGPQVRRGCPGWLFLASELAVHPDGPANAAARAQAVARVQQDLAGRGIGLLVAVVPDKTRIEADRLCGLHRPAALAGRVSQWTGMLAARGVAAVDLTQALQAVQPDAFLRTDTHWNEAGAGAAARVLAERIRATGVSLEPARQYDVGRQPERRRPGDLVRLAGLDWLPPALQPAPETVAEHDYTARAQAADSADDLFGDAGLPGIAVIGTSFSRTSNFVPQLGMALGTAVGNFARDGGEFSGAALAYFASQAWRRTPPRLIVWEIPERDLQSPLAEGDTAILPTS